MGPFSVTLLASFKHEHTMSATKSGMDKISTDTELTCQQMQSAEKDTVESSEKS